MLGLEVATLVNENKPTGSYSVNFDAGKLSNGPTEYIYIDFKQVILLKLRG